MSADQLRVQVTAPFLSWMIGRIPAVLSAVQQRLVVFFDGLVDRLQALIGLFWISSRYRLAALSQQAGSSC